MKKRVNMSLQKRNALAGYLFILPWFSGLCLFVLRPIYQSLLFAFHDVKLFPDGRQLLFVGWQNFIDIWIRDLYFMTRLLAFFMNTILRVPVIVVFALMMALLINQKIQFQGWFRTLFFLPVIMVSGPVINELIAQGVTTVPMLDTAQISHFLNQLFPNWMAAPIADIFNQIILILWFSGVQILIFLAALQKVSPSLYEAAKIDGGSAWECFWKITLPTIKPIILVNLIYTVVTLSNSETNEIMTLIMLNVFSGTRGYGFAAAMAWMYTLLVAMILLFIFSFFIEREDKRIKANKKRHKKEQKFLRKAQKTIARQDAKMQQQRKRALKKQTSSTS